MTESRVTAAREGHTPASLADVLERDYFPMPEGAKLYLAEGEWRMVIAALRAQGSESVPAWKGKERRHTIDTAIGVSERRGERDSDAKT